MAARTPRSRRDAGHIRTYLRTALERLLAAS